MKTDAQFAKWLLETHPGFVLAALEDWRVVEAIARNLAGAQRYLAEHPAPAVQTALKAARQELTEASKWSNASPGD